MTFTQTELDERVAELKRRLADRNAPGYWGCNARAWAHKIIRELRANAALVAKHYSYDIEQDCAVHSKPFNHNLVR